MESDSIQLKLQHHLAFEHLITGLSTKFINLPSQEIDQGIREALKAIGEFAGVDRSYIFLFSDNGEKMSNTHEWCAEGIPTQLPSLQDMPVNAFPWFAEKIRGFEILYVPRVSELGDGAKAEKEVFLAGQIQSLVCVPMVHRDALVGFLGFDSVRSVKEWSEENIALLKIAGEMFVNIIVRKQIEDALRESLGKYEAVLGGYDGLIYICSPKHKLEFVNQKLIEYLGYDPTGEDCFKALHELEQPCSWCIDAKVFKGEAVHQEMLSPKDNRWYHITNTPLLHADGSVSKMALVEDITKHKQAEEELIKLNECFLSFGPDHIRNIDTLTRTCGELLRADCALYNHLGEKMLYSWGHWNIPGNVPLVHNPQGSICAEVIGKESEEIVLVRNFDQSPFSAHPSVAGKNFKTYFGKAVKSGNTHVGSLCVLYQHDFIPSEDDKRVLGLIASAIEVEENRRDAEESIKKSELFLNSVFSSIQDGISVLDTDFTIMRVNLVMEQWYAHAMPLVGKKCYQAYHCRQKACDVCPTRKTLETGQTAYEVVPFTDKDGKTVGWQDLYSFPLINPSTGKMEGVIEYVRDISSRRKAEDEKTTLNNELIKTNARLKQFALRDPHTGLFNHRYLEEIIESEFYRSRRYAQPLAVMMLDIDYFKSINDVYGHTFGDTVLKQLARLLKQMVRRYDALVRYGGEEFLVICSGSDRASAVALAKRLLDAINLFDFGNKKQSVKLKLSIAVAAYPEDRATKGMDLVALTDQIIGRAKESGGNRVYSSLDINKKKSALLLDNGTSNVRKLRDKIDTLNKNVNQGLIEAIFAFAKTIEAKDHGTGEHVERTVRYATDVARALRLPERDIELIRQAAMLHDLGKIGVSESILLKKGKLTKKEFEEIKKHPQIGVEIIRPIHFLHPIIPILLHHHERWDGKGYPAGLKGEDIPMGARIVAIADVFQALISDRPYRKAFSPKQAMEIIRKESGKIFDPQIADTFLRIVRKVR
jgi:diguanylate cyclase (GGDEF)-like protein